MEMWNSIRDWCSNSSRWKIIKRVMEKWKMVKMALINLFSTSYI
jgi:hypothetical protein